ncbi:MAG TPA: hypothetical protein VJH65_00195 [Candidatus Nanoarchaeia archaeon]|nr:hypothetical protein [Candidatus Nanoarchaeia archaeon]
MKNLGKTLTALAGTLILGISPAFAQVKVNTAEKPICSDYRYSKQTWSYIDLLTTVYKEPNEEESDSDDSSDSEFDIKSFCKGVNSFSEKIDKNKDKTVTKEEFIDYITNSDYAEFFQGFFG